MIISHGYIPEKVPHLDTVLITHYDNDYYCKLSCTELVNTCFQKERIKGILNG